MLTLRFQKKRQSDKETLLHSAASVGLLECCQVLLDNGADVNATTHRTAKTVLEAALLTVPTERTLPCVELLLQHGAHVTTRALRHACAVPSNGVLTALLKASQLPSDALQELIGIQNEELRDYLVSKEIAL
eukprot:TRINITY_DN6503_c0_g1_i1.p1 TRINITY_DN6503_c0_g1~~TRINITY_DN6503_c0_g1_i1.p1  ORF type:complete len:132 (+),score=17.52 TRINITY_DN6503_c0_g1_i1:179-574(+)